MKILVIDDKPDQRELAVKAVKEAGHEPVVASCLDDAITEIMDVDGVITDFYYNAYGSKWSSDERFRAYEATPPPCGTAVVIAALQLGKPVAICTDGNHHGIELSWFHDAFLSNFASILQSEATKANPNYYDENPFDHDNPRPLMAFGWFERKDWESAVRFIEKRTALAG